jgi:hypothetical protein
LAAYLVALLLACPQRPTCTVGIVVTCLTAPVYKLAAYLALLLHAWLLWRIHGLSQVAALRWRQWLLGLPPVWHSCSWRSWWALLVMGSAKNAPFLVARAAMAPAGVRAATLPAPHHVPQRILRSVAGLMCAPTISPTTRLLCKVVAHPSPSCLAQLV